MGKSKCKYYAVRKGFVPGIYYSWEECQKQINKFSGAQFKSFKSLWEAEQYMNTSVQKTKVDKKGSYAYVSGCFNNLNKSYGYGGIIFHEGQKYEVQGGGNDNDLINIGSVASQILASKETIKKAINLEIRNIDIYYDYDGIEKWANGDWKRNLKETKDYYNFIQEISPIININFIKNKKNNPSNEKNEASYLAKKAAGNISNNENINNIDNISTKGNNIIIEKHIKKRIIRNNNFNKFELKKLPDYIKAIFQE